MNLQDIWTNELRMQVIFQWYARFLTYGQMNGTLKCDTNREEMILHNDKTHKITCSFACL